MKDLYHNLAGSMANATIKTAYSTTQLSQTPLDTACAEGVLVVTVVGTAGLSLSSDIKIELELEECATISGTYTDVSNSDLSYYEAGTNQGCYAVIAVSATAPGVYYTSYHGSKRYIRPVYSFVGTHTAATPLVSFYMVAPKKLPQ